MTPVPAMRACKTQPLPSVACCALWRRVRPLRVTVARRLRER